MRHAETAKKPTGKYRVEEKHPTRNTPLEDKYLDLLTTKLRKKLNIILYEHQNISDDENSTMQAENDPFNNHALNGIGSIPSPLHGDPELRKTLSKFTGMDMDIDDPPTTENPTPFAPLLDSPSLTSSAQSLTNTPTSEAASLNKSSRRAEDDTTGPSERDSKRLKASGGPKPSEGRTYAQDLINEAPMQAPQPKYTTTNNTLLSSVSRSRETLSAQKKPKDYETTTELNTPSYGHSDANAMIQRQRPDSQHQTPRKAQLPLSNSPRSMPRRTPLPLGNSTRPTTPSKASEKLGAPQPKLSRVQTTSPLSRQDDVENWNAIQRRPSSYNGEEDEFPRHLGYDLDEEEEYNQFPTPPRSYVKGVVHGMDDYTKFTNMHKDMKTGWDNIEGHKVLVYSHGATFTGQYHQEIQLLSDAVAEILNVPSPQLSPPSAEKNKRNAGAAPWPFLISDINEEQERTLCDKRWYCNGHIACHFLPYHPKPSTFWLSIDRLLLKNNEEGYTAVLELVIKTFNAESFRSWLRGQIEKAGNNLPEGLSLDDSVDYMLSSIEIKSLAIEDKEGNPPRIVWNIYGAVHTTILKYYYDFIKKLNETDFLLTRFGHGIPLEKPFQCIMCKSIDHPTGHCPFPGLEGWIEPETFIGTQTGGKGRNGGSLAANVRGAPRGAGRGNYRGNAQGRGGKRGGRNIPS